MKKIKLYIAVTIDGYIAHSDGDVDWLTSFQYSNKTDVGYKEFLETVDTVILGGNTYQEIASMDVIWPYKGKATFVVSRHPILPMKDEKLQVIADNAIETISALKNADGKDIWLAGGGELTAMLLDNNLIDEMQILYFPVMLGSGIPLFPERKIGSQWTFAGCTSFDNGIVKVCYQRK